MAKKVLVVSTSLRGNSNSEILAKECERGAKDAGHEVEFVSLRGKDIRFCIGCMTCQKTGRCVLKDDVAEIMAKVKESEVIIFATPIYYYEMCGDAHAIDKAYNGLQGWVDCFEKAERKGYVFGKGIAEPGDARNHTETLLDAYNLGKSL